MDLGREHALSPMEARDLPRGRLRPVHRPLAQGDHGQGRGSPAVRAHHRHGAHRPRPPRHRAAAGASAAWRSRPIAGRELRAHPQRRGGRERAPHAVLRDARAPLALPRRLASGVPVAGALVRRVRRGIRTADLLGEAVGARRHRLGAVPRRRGPRREPRRRRREPRPAHRHDRHLVRRGGQVQRATDRRQRHRAGAGGEAADRRAARLLRLLPRHPVRAVLRRPSGTQPAAQHHRRGRHPRRGRRRRAAGARESAAGGYTFYVMDGHLHYAHNYLGRSVFEVASERQVPPGYHALRFEFEPTGELDFLRARVRRADCSSTSTRPGGQRRHRSQCP